jgi:5-bromo-4-chloroindolyl phosphate hydrolysis protein
MTIGYSIFTSFFSVFSTTSFITLGLLFFSFVLSGALALRGISLRKRVKRFKHYVNTLKSNKFCSIEELALSIRKKNKYVVRDLRKMIDLGMFPQAHIDDKKTYFMINDEVYEEYLNSQEALKRRKEAELKRQEELNKEINDPEKRKLRYTLELGNSYIEQIKTANDVINREEISAKLSRLENIVSQIFKYLENNPKKLSEVNKFTNHYLPITLKLVNAYKELNDQPVQGENITSAKNEIEKTIDTINSAFEKLLDDLFGEVALDISTDISVLETLFTQEGLTKNDFKK